MKASNIFLFRLIDDKKVSDPEELKMSFLAAKPTSSFNTVFSEIINQMNEGFGL